MQDQKLIVAFARHLLSQNIICEWNDIRFFCCVLFKLGEMEIVEFKGAIDSEVIFLTPLITCNWKRIVGISVIFVCLPVSLSVFPSL